MQRIGWTTSSGYPHHSECLAVSLGSLIGCENPCEDDIVDAMIILYKTFVPESMMHEGQIVAVEKEYKEKEERSYEEILKESKDGVLELQLEP